MDKFVRVYSGGELVKGPTGVEFGDLSEEGIWFKVAPTYGELIDAVRKKLGLEPATHSVRVQGRMNVGGGAHRHFIMVPISDDMSWRNYVKAVFNGTDWNCLEVYVQAEKLFKEKSLRKVAMFPENGNGADQAMKFKDIKGDLTSTRQKLQSSQEEIDDLQRNLENAAILSKEHSRLQEQNKGLEAEIINLKDEMASARRHFDDKLSESDAEISKYRQELSAASEKLLQEKSTNSAKVGKLQEAIQNTRCRLEEVSEEKSLVEEQVKELEEATAEAEKHRQELIHAAEMLLEDKFRQEAEMLTLRQSMEDLKP
ncbi:unnamed protein product [Alopecurus aequalis]